MAAFKPAYLIHGDDHGRIAERRARLRGLAEAESGPQGIEVLEGDAATPEAVATALCAMTFALGRRFVIVDGTERWKDAGLAPLEPVLANLPPETTVAFFAREERRLQVAPRLVQAVKAAGGDVSAAATVKPWELPRWLVARAAEMGVELHPAAAKALVHTVGERQQRLLREVEKIALELEPGTPIGLEHAETLAAASSERRVWALADALVARDGPAAARAYLGLRAQGERLPGLLYGMTRRLRDAHDAVGRLERGESAAQVKRSLRMPPRAADRFLADAQRSDATGLRHALEALADLELASRGGGPGGLGEDTLALRAIARIAG